MICKMIWRVVKLIGSAIETKQKNIYMQCSDMGLFSGLVFDLDLPERRKTQLIRYFCRSKNLFDGLLERLVAPLTKNTTKQTTKPIEKNQPTRQNLTDLDRLFQDYQNIISAEKNFPPLEKEIIQQIKTFTQLKESGENILPQLETFIPQFGKQYKKALSSFAKHLETFNRLNMVDIKKVRFSAMPDLKMAYYTGFMFSFSKNDILYGAGGRYDDLLEDLGGDVPIPAVGGAVFLDRLLEA